MDSTKPACSNPRLNVLIQRVQFAARRSSPETVADRVGAVLQPFLGEADLLLPSQCEPDPDRYRQHILHVEDDGSFSIVALVWLPGQSTPVHDHVSWCVVGVHQGQELGISYAMADVYGVPSLLPSGLTRNGVGTVEALTPPGDIHCVINPGPGLAISLHVYGADVRKLGTSIRRRYEIGAQPVEPSRLVARAS